MIVRKRNVARIALCAAIIGALIGAAHVYAQATVITDCSSDQALRNAIAAGGTQTITFNCGTATIPFSSFIAVTNGSTISVDGGGRVTLDGGNGRAFFQVSTGATFTLQSITLTRGAFNGAYPLENFGTLLLDTVTVTHHATTGSAVTNYGTLTIHNSVFSSNSITGATNRSGAALKNDGGNVQIQATTFSNNIIANSGGTGGAIANQSGNMTISGSTFSANSAFDGGALYINSSTSVTVTQTLFTANTAGYGGAIENNGNLHAAYSSFHQNSATVGDGGALWTLGNDTTLSYSTFADNQSATTGGGISCYSKTLAISSSTISGNQAGDNGAGIYSTCTLNVSNSTLSGNSTPGKGGGGIYQTSGGAAIIVAATIAGNTAAFGAGVYNDGAGTSSMSLQSTLLVNNSTGNCDGVLTSGGYNLSTDTHCAALTMTGDQQNIALPLGSLGDNGGPTFTHLPLTGNPAIDGMPAPCSFGVDQRNAARPAGTRCDIGAVEVGATPPATPTPITPTPTSTTSRLYLPLLGR